MSDAPNAPSPEGAPNASPTPSAKPPEPKKKKGLIRRLFQLVFIFFVVVIVGLIFLPTIATSTFLTGTVRSQLRAQTNESSDVSKVAWSWTKGIQVDELKLAPGPDARVKDRAPVTLGKLDAKVDVLAAVKAVATGGECQAGVDVENVKVYLELLPGGKTNLPFKQAKETAAVASETRPTTTGETKKEATQLPVAARSILNAKAIDVEVADMTSSTGAIQRIVLKGLQLGVLATVTKDVTATVDTLKDEKNAERPTLSFDELRVTLEQPGQKDRLLVAMEKPSITTKLTYHSTVPASAANAPMASLAAAHQVEAQPTIGIANLYGDDFDLHTVGINVSLQEEQGKRIAAIVIDGTMYELPHTPGHEAKLEHGGKVKITIRADLGAKPRLPCTLDVSFDRIDITGAVAKYVPRVCPVLEGISSERGANKLPPLTFASNGELAAFFDEKGQVQKDPTLKSIKDSGLLELGKGNLAGSKILEGFLAGFEKLNVKDLAMKAIGDRGFEFDQVTESFDVKDGVITIPKLEMVRQNFGLHVQGQSTLEGKYKVSVGLADVAYANMEPDTAKLLKSVDRAGGITIEGEGANYTVTTPPADVLAKALLEGGALDLFRSKNPKMAGQLDAALGKAGVSVDKVLEDPKKAAEDAAKKQANDQVDKQIDKNKEKIEKATGIDAEKLKKFNPFGGSSDEPKKEDGSKSEEPKKEDPKTEEPKKEEPKANPFPFKNPFGGGN